MENCSNTGFDYAIVTDSDEIEQQVKASNGNVVRVDDDVTTGSERIALAYERFFSEKNYQYIINVQGDEPLLTGDLIKELAKAHEASHFDIFTAVKKRSRDDDDFSNPNVVKAVFSEDRLACLYFSRSSVPHFRDSNNENGYWFQHIGLYSYQVEALKKFVSYEESLLEKTDPPCVEL